MISNIIPRILKPSDPNSTSTTLNKSASSVLTIFILGAHLVLAFMFKIYFFSFNTDIVGGGGKNSGDGSAATTTMSTSTTSTAAAALATP